jgi:hypothetical protein
MQAQSRMTLQRERPLNCFLLCTILAKEGRRLGRLRPDRRIPELIAMALKNCADYELMLDIDAGVLKVVREKAMQIGCLTRRSQTRCCFERRTMGQGSDCPCRFDRWWARPDRS